MNKCSLTITGLTEYQANLLAKVLTAQKMQKLIESICPSLNELYLSISEYADIDQNNRTAFIRNFHENIR